MLDATFMKTLCYSYLSESDIERRIHSAASIGNVGISFDAVELSADMYDTLIDAGYRISADTFIAGNLYVTWG